jgi:site-specific recombinase XerD
MMPEAAIPLTGEFLPAVSEPREFVPGANRTLLALIEEAGNAARFAYEEFFEGEISNPHTRRAYHHAVHSFLGWCEARQLELGRISPADVGRYFSEHRGSIPTKKLHLAALRCFFDKLVVRHVVVLNPAASVRAERYQVVEGRTREITVEQARTLLKSIALDSLLGLRDRAVIGILIYTAARVGAVAKLSLKDFFYGGDQWCLRFLEKGGKSREIPVRHDLQEFILNYLDAAGIRDEAKERPLFRTVIRKTKQFTSNGMTAGDMTRMLKRRLKAAGLPQHLSPHSFRVTTITNLLEQGVGLEEVQRLAGHADPRTTRLYDRRDKKISRNIVERISI